MKVVLEIQEDKADVFMEMIENIPFVKVKRKETKKEKFLAELEEAIEELNQIKAGKKKGQDAREFLRRWPCDNECGCSETGSFPAYYLR